MGMGDSLPEESTTPAERYRALAALARDRARSLSPIRAKEERAALERQAENYTRLSRAAETVEETTHRFRRIAEHERQEARSCSGEAAHHRGMARHYDRIAAELEATGAKPK